MPASWDGEASPNSQAEITSLAEQAGLEIASLSLDADETTWPYAIFFSRRGGDEQLPER